MSIVDMDIENVVVREASASSGRGEEHDMLDADGSGVYVDFINDISQCFISKQAYWPSRTSSTPPPQPQGRLSFSHWPASAH